TPRRHVGLWPAGALASPVPSSARAGSSPSACRAMLLVAGALCIACTSAAAQQPTDAAGCRGSALSLKKIVTLGDSGDGYVGLPISVVRWQNGWAVTHNAKPESVSVFDNEGRFVRDIGRAGEGPGEFRLASLLVPKR